MSSKFPIIYVRGFAGGQGAIDDAVSDPFYGFNAGSVHVRVGAEGTPRFYQYEGPLVRLNEEQGYKLHVHGNQQQVLLDAEPGQFEPDTIWIYRFYDKSTGTFGIEPQSYDIETAAKGLADYIELVREKTDGHPPVYLIAHSMGGLICRTALERMMDDPAEAVSKLATMGTPHGGIDPQLGGGIGDWILKTFGPQGSDIFSPDHMRQYMFRPDPKADPDVRKSRSFDPDRILSIVGTNAHDYEVAAGLSAAIMGPQSDGLVAIKNAYVHDSARAYIHRSHSGRFGLVNSEEAYQNLKRFLFGGLRIEVDLDGLELNDGLVWQAEVRLAIRGLPVLIHEQTAANYCPVDLNAQAKDRETPLSPVPLVTTFLMTDGQVARYALDFKVTSLDERAGMFGFGEHLEQIGDWRDALIIEVSLDGSHEASAVHWGWNTTLGGRPGQRDSELPNRLDWEPGHDGQAPTLPSIPLPDAARKLLGAEARLALKVAKWA